MEDRNFQQPSENIENKSKAKVFFKHLGLYAIALALAILTVFVLNF